MRQLTKFFEQIAFGFVFTAIAGLILIYGPFAKVKFGHLYILEVLWLGWALCAVCSGTVFKTLLEAFFNKSAPLLPLSLFALWGLVRFSWDFHSRGNYPAIEMAQNGILFAYPLLWGFAGFWCAQVNPRKTKNLALVVLVIYTVRGFYQYLSGNFSVGPLAAVGFAFFLAKARKRNDWIVAACWGLLAFIPFWKMWFDGTMPRTSMILFFVPALLVPFFLRSKAKIWKRMALFPGIFFLGVFLATFAAAFLQKDRNLKDAAVLQFYSNLQHGEDMTHDEIRGGRIIENRPFFQFRDRRFWWRTSLAEWTERPFLGKGFAFNFPTQVRPNILNDGVFEGAPDLKIASPGRPIRGPHNSYLTILARMGLLGFGLLFWAVFVWWRRTRDSSYDLATITVFFIAFNGLAHAFLNVGLETPYNCLVLWLFFGVGIRTLQDKNSKVLFI